MIFNFVYKWFDPVLSIKNINHVAFWMFLTKTSNVIESFMWTHFDVLLVHMPFIGSKVTCNHKASSIIRVTYSLDNVKF